MSKNIFEWEKWFGSPLSLFFEKLNSLDPEELRGTDRWKYVTSGFRGLYFDIVMMFRLIGQITRRLNRDFENIIEHYPPRGKWSPSDPEDELFNVLFLAQIDFTSLIVFLGILLEKVARLLHNITKGNRPYSIRFSKWRNEIRNEKYVVPDDLKKLMEDTPWYDEFYKLRNKYTVHYGYSIGGIINNTKIQLLSHNEQETEIIYDIEDIKKISSDIYLFFNDLNEFLCGNFDIFPIKMSVNTEGIKKDCYLTTT